MVQLRMSECRIGARVWLTNPDPEYDIGRSNPAVGTDYECSGFITRMDDEGIHVRWQNSSKNVYQDLELSCASTDRDQHQGRCRSIW